MDNRSTKRHDLSDSAWTRVAIGPSNVALLWEGVEGILIAVGKDEPALSSPNCFVFSRQFGIWIGTETSIWARMQDDAAPGSILVLG